MELPSDEVIRDQLVNSLARALYFSDIQRRHDMASLYTNEIK